MATKLDHIKNLPPITHQGVVRFEIAVPHESIWVDEGVGSVHEMLIDKDKIVLRYDVLTWDGEGNVVKRASRRVPVADWPKVVKRDMETMYQRIVADAKANNLIGAGSDEPI